MTQHHEHLVLLTGGTGTTGRRIAARLAARGVAVRCASRSGTPPFDWNAPATWAANLDGATAAYIAYSPDVTIPGAVDTIREFSAAASRAGVGKLVLLSVEGDMEVADGA